MAEIVITKIEIYRFNINNAKMISSGEFVKELNDALLEQTLCLLRQKIEIIKYPEIISTEYNQELRTVTVFIQWQEKQNIEIPPMPKAILELGSDESTPVSLNINNGRDLPHY